MLLLYKVHGTKYILLLYKVAPIDSYKTCLIGTANRFSYPDMPYVNGRIESRCRQWQPLRKNDQIGDRHLISCWFYWPSSKLVKNGSSSYLIASYGRPDRDLIFDSVETKALSLSRGHPLVLNASYWLLYTVCKLIPLFPRKKIEANPWSLVRGDKYGTVHVKCCKSSCKGFNGRTQLWLVSRGAYVKCCKSRCQTFNVYDIDITGQHFLVQSVWRYMKALQFLDWWSMNTRICG